MKKRKIAIYALISITIILGILIGVIISNNNNEKTTNNITYEISSKNEIIENELDENKIKETNNSNTVDSSNTISTENTTNKNNTTNISTADKNETQRPENNVNTNSHTKTETKPKTEATTETTTKTKEEEQTIKRKTGKVIAIDPGHQKKGDSSKEPIGPGATETKAKVTTGATGVSTKQTEAMLNLKVGLLLKTELEKRGYTVIMTRTTNDVNISNSQRAEIANKANADAFIRIHADSYESPKVVGMSTLCQTSKNKYNGNLAEKSYKLSKCVLDNMVKTTGAKNRGVTRTDTMSGINWAKVPTTIVEMGFLSNPEEDKLLASEEYQIKLVKGMANGIDEFLK